MQRNSPKFGLIAYVLSIATLFPTLGMATHYIVVLPGLGCTNKDCMKPLEARLEQEMRRRNVDETFRILSFAYPSDPTADAYDLARGLGNFFETTFRDSLGVSDRISLVGYSQGGIVGLLWLQHAFRNSPGYAADYRRWMTHFVTLATPFWGTEVASVGALIKGSQIKELSTAIPFAKVQLEELSSLSHTMFRFRTKATREEFSDISRQIGTSIKRLSIVGALGESPTLAQLGLKSLDTDLTVPVPSANPNLIFAQVSAEKRPQKITQDQFRKTTPEIPVHVIRAVHAAVPGVDIPAIHEAGSEAAQIVVDHLTDRTSGTPPWRSSVGSVRRAQIQVTVELPRSVHATRNDVDLYFQGGSFWRRSQVNSVIDMDPLTLGPVGNFRAGTIRAYREFTQFHFTATGSLKTGFKPHVKLKLRVRGFADREIDMPLEAGFTTYLNVRY